MLKTAGVQQFDWYPMARARLVAVNGKAVHSTDYEEDRAQRLVEREFNISHAAQAPGHNEVVAGRYVPNEPDAFSVEEGLAKTLGLKLGDRLRFDFAGVVQEGRITSLRKVDWSSMRVNFFVIAPQADMPQWPITYISAFRSPANSTLDRDMVQAFPNLTVVDVSATLTQIQAILGQVITAVEFLFAFTLAAGLIVLMAGLLTTRERRAADWAIWRAMGGHAEALVARSVGRVVDDGGAGGRIGRLSVADHRLGTGCQGIRVRMACSVVVAHLGGLGRSHPGRSGWMVESARGASAASHDRAAPRRLELDQ